MGPLQWLGHQLARYLARPRPGLHVATSRPGLLATTLRKGDVLLVEGTSRFSAAIRTIRSLRNEQGGSHGKAL